MEDFWSTQQFSNHHPQRPSFHLIPAAGAPQQFSSQEKNQATSFFSARRSVNALDWLETGGKNESGCDHAEAALWEVNSGPNLNPAVSKWSQSVGELQNWDLGSSCETPSPLSEVPWFQPTPLSQMGTLPSLDPTSQKAGPFAGNVVPQLNRSIPESHWPVWGSAPAKREHFGSEKFFNANACSSAAPPFPFSHLDASVLSPPLTPLPSHSPATTCSRSNSQGGDDNEALHFFVSNPQPLPLPWPNSSGATWTFPAGSNGTTQGNLSASHNITEELPSPGKSSLKSPREPNHARPRQASGGAAHLWKAQMYTGTPFPSVLHSKQETRAHYTPRPLLNPARQGTGLYSSFSSIRPTEKEQHAVEAMINIGSDFQAALPPLTSAEDGERRTCSESLWKSCEEAVESGTTQEQVDKLLLLSRSSCFPGGGSNVELALHCLHACRADIMATLEMLLLTGTSPTEDYHYAGSDVWNQSERRTFNRALKTHGKNFWLIHKTVKTKSVKQCVEFYYLITKSHAKQHQHAKLKNRDEMEGESEQGKSEIEMPASPPAEKQPGPGEACPAPPLAGSFPCTKCGKMFTKVKSRNAHMKIHRKFPKAWRNRLPVQHLPPAVDSSGDDFYHQSAHHSLTPGNFAYNDAGLPVASTYTGDPNVDVGAIVDAIQREAPYASVFNQSWHFFEEFQMKPYVP